MASVRTVAQDCLDASGTISVREDVMGVYGDDNPQDRSLLAQLGRIQHDDFVRVALVTVRPTGSTAGQNGNLQRDLDNTNTVYQGECDLWVYPVGSRVVTTGILGTNVLLDQDDCSGNGHSVSDEEDDLFDLGRDMGADIVCYYINGDVAGFAGCAAHPDGRRGFWVGNAASPWTFAHELTHVVGDNGHSGNNNNLMFTPTANIQNAPPDLTNGQCNRIGNDPDVEGC
ncbi:MAG: hypothetical protein R3324_05150 [Halobacteriales archaeon]|nr:hypothetical protein [Halobacteriales archaeon]